MGSVKQPDLTSRSSCQQLRDAGLGSTDRTDRTDRTDHVCALDPRGTGTAAVGSDMTTNGGGWTVAGWQAAEGMLSLGRRDWGVPGAPAWSTRSTCSHEGVPAPWGSAIR